MEYRVVFAPEAETQLAELYRFIASDRSRETALRYTTAIVDHCERLATMPRRGMLRDDIRPGLRITNYRGRTVIAFSIHGDSVEIVGIFYAGRDFEAALHTEDDL